MPTVYPKHNRHSF